MPRRRTNAVICPMAFCGWVWAYDPDVDGERRRAEAKEYDHWKEYHSVKAVDTGVEPAGPEGPTA